jgi:hypothetical protein
MNQSFRLAFALIVAFIALREPTSGQHVEWTTYLSPIEIGLTSIPQQVIRTADSGFVVLVRENRTGTGRTPISTRVVRLSPQGDTIWSRTLRGKYAMNGTQAYQRDDGFIIVAGRERVGNWSMPENDWQPALVALSPDGDSLWQKSYAAPRFEPSLDHKNIHNLFVSIVPADNGHTLMLNRGYGFHYMLLLDAIGRVQKTLMLDLRDFDIRRGRQRSDGTIDLPFINGSVIGVLRMSVNGDTISSVKLTEHKADRYYYLKDILYNGTGYVLGAALNWNPRGTDKQSAYVLWADTTGTRGYDTLINPDLFFNTSFTVTGMAVMSNGGTALFTTDTAAIWRTNENGRRLVRMGFTGSWLPVTGFQSSDGGFIVAATEPTGDTGRAMLIKISPAISAVSVLGGLPDHFDLD